MHDVQHRYYFVSFSGPEFFNDEVLHADDEELIKKDDYNKNENAILKPMNHLNTYIDKSSFGVHCFTFWKTNFMKCIWFFLVEMSHIRLNVRDKMLLFTNIH